MNRGIKKFMRLVLSAAMLISALYTTALADAAYSVDGEISDGKLNAEITDTANDKDVTAYIAEYDSEGRLVRVSADKDAKGGKTISDYDLDGKTETVKIFLWENENIMKPVTDTVFEKNVSSGEQPSESPAPDPSGKKTAAITIKFQTEEGDTVKPDVTLSEEYSDGDTYTVPDEYRTDVVEKPAGENKLYTLYSFNESTSQLTAPYEETMTLILRFNSEQYDYYENFEDYAIDASKLHKGNGAAEPTIESDNSRYYRQTTTTSSNGGYMTFDEINTENKIVKISADVKFVSAELDPKLGQFAISNTSPSFSDNNIQYGVNNTCSGHIFLMEYDSGNGIKVNGEYAGTDGADSKKFENTWVHADIEADFGQSTVAVKLTNTNGDTWEKTQGFYSSTAAGNLGSFYLRAPSTNGTVCFDNFAVKIMGDAEPAPPNVTSVINNKSVYAFGDSIVYGHNTPAKSFMRLIADDYAIKLNMMAKNGATIMSSKNQILTQINNAPAAAPDFVVFEGYTNDAYGSAENDPEFNPNGANRDVTACYGEITPASQLAPPFNTDTFCGSFENTIYTMKQKWGNDVKYVYVTIHKSGARKFEIQQKLHDLTVAMCEKWNVAVVDMFKDSTLDTRNEDEMSKYMIDKKGSHPNETACREFYIPAVVKVMEGLLEEEQPSASPTASPSTEPDYEAEKTFKFDFGASGQTAVEGYTAVSPDMVYDMAKNDAVEGYCGFLGTQDDSYEKDVLPGNMDNRAIDGFTVIKGQKIVLGAGGEDSASDANSDYVTVPKAEDYVQDKDRSTYEGRYPILFSMKADWKSYYTVTATVANSSDTDNANVSLFSEKRQIVAEDVALAPGETATFRFNVDIEDVYYKLYTTFEDDMLNVCVSGENAALASVIVEKHKKNAGTVRGESSDAVNDGVTMWLMTDSTGCDCGATVPFFALQNYAGVGQALVKYMPENIAVSNQGERGLASNDNMHLAKAMLKPGDYLYVEYGHNDNGAASYKSNLEKYYEIAHKSGAKLIIASAVNRINTYNDETSSWESSFTSYITAARDFVRTKIDGGADDVAFVDLNTKYVEWMNAETNRVVGINPAITKKDALNFYYKSVKGGAVDITHLNDAGADQGAYAFFTAAKDIVTTADGGSDDKYVKAQAEVVRPIVEGMKTKIGDTQLENKPMTVSDEIIMAGKAPNEYWDTVPSASLEYVNKAAVDKVGFTTDENGAMTISSVDMRVLGSVTYAKAVITVKNGENVTKYYTENNYDCTGDGVGSVKSNSGFITSNKAHTDVSPADKTAAITVPVGAECTVQIVEANQATWVADESNALSVAYPVYPETEETFTDGMSNITPGTVWDASAASGNDWNISSGASEYSATVSEEGDGNYITAYSSGGGKNYAFYKAIGGDTGLSEGRYRISFKARLNAGLVRVLLAQSVQSSGATGSGTAKDYIVSIESGAVKINDVAEGALDIVKDDKGAPQSMINTGEWINVDGVFDLNLGKITLSVGGSEYKTMPVANWRAITPTSLPAKYLVIAGDSGNNATEADIKDLRVAKIPNGTPEKLTVSAKTSNNTTAQGTVAIDGEASDATVTKQIDEGASVTFTASAASGYKFKNWTSGDTEVSQSAEYTTRVFEDTELTANFEHRSENEIVWDFSDLSEGQIHDSIASDTSVTYKNLNIYMTNGDKLTSPSGLYWSAKGTGDETSESKRYVHYKPETAGIITFTVKASNVDSSHKARLYFNKGSDASATVKGPLNSASPVQYKEITAKDTETKLTYTLEANQDYVFWMYLYSISSNFTVSSISFTPAS